MKDIGPGSAMWTYASGQVSRVRVLGDRPGARCAASVACGLRPASSTSLTSPDPVTAPSTAQPATGP
jgi:hypothetical protein